MKARGLRTPSQSARALCFWMHETEQVRAVHRGHLYLGGSVWQMLHSVLSTVPDMAALTIISMVKLSSAFSQGFILWNSWTAG
jgi:hypothetical protein